jgi:2-polyprenyl-3-methyl-5-hydroxy-6-metoxy-1,4-benzoquinol methylase
MKEKSKKKTVERIYLSNEEFLKVENEIRFHEHLRRYAAIRRFCYGKVLDFACGCGYGSFLLAVNPEVSEITAIDIDKDAVEWAKKEFQHKKIRYIVDDIKNLNEAFDTLVSLETIEHMKDLSVIRDLIKRCEINHLILSFPDKKSTHFNPYHFHDFVLQEIADLFPAYLVYHSFRSGDVQFVQLMKLPANAPAHIFRNIKDL